MNKPTIIYVLLFFTFFTSSLGEEYSDFNRVKPGFCRAVRLDDSDKSCIYLKSEFKELPNECSEYKGSVATECESIIHKGDNTMCIFGSNGCQSKIASSCSDYKVVLIEELCKNISPSEGVECELVNNECKPYYSDCSDYKGQDKNTCESIELENPFRYYLYTEGKGCEE